LNNNYKKPLTFISIWLLLFYLFILFFIFSRMQAYSFWMDNTVLPIML